MDRIKFDPSNEIRYIPLNMNFEERFPFICVGKDSYACDIVIKHCLDISDKKECYNFQIGNYTSIGCDVEFIIDMNHDYKSVYQVVIELFGTGDISKEGLGQIVRRIKRKGQIIIGSDVWIGDNVTVLGGVTIGNGAVVAAGSVVVKEVPPYSIVGGNPAKIISYRFDEEICDKLKLIQWWNFSDEELLKAKEDLQGDPKLFVERYFDKVNFYERKSGNFVPRVTKEDIPRILVFIESDTRYPLYSYAIESFIAKYMKGGAELIIAYSLKDEIQTEIAKKLTDILGEIESEELMLNICGMEEEDEEAVISEVDYLITGRDKRNIIRMDYASKYGVDIISGADVPIQL